MIKIVLITFHYFLSWVESVGETGLEKDGKRDGNELEKKIFETQTQNHARHDKTIYGIAKENRITCEICFMVQSLKL